MHTNGKRAVIYTRISRDRDGESLGVARQEKLCRAIAKAAGVDVVGVLTDNDVSATSSRERPGFVRLCDNLAAGLYDVVIALDTDRLLRKLGDLATLFDLCEKHGVRVMYEHGGFDPATGDGMFEASIRASVDGEEVRKLKKRVNRKVTELAEAGAPGSMGGARPFGYEDDRITVREAEAVIIREAVARLLAGETVRGLCKDLNGRGIRTSTGGTWVPQSLRRLVLSARIMGVREHKGEIYPAQWEAICERDDVVALRAMFNDPDG